MATPSFAAGVPHRHPQIKPLAKSGYNPQPRARNFLKFRPLYLTFVYLYRMISVLGGFRPVERFGTRLERLELRHVRRRVEPCRERTHGIVAVSPGVAKRSGKGVGQTPPSPVRRASHSGRPLPHSVGGEVGRGCLLPRCDRTNHPTPLAPRSGERSIRATGEERVRGDFKILRTSSRLSDRPKRYHPQQDPRTHHEPRN